MAVENILLDEQLVALQFQGRDIPSPVPPRITSEAITEIDTSTLSYVNNGDGTVTINLTFTPGALASKNQATNPPDSAPAQGPAYVQADAQAVLTELRALKSALLAAGITV